MLYFVNKEELEDFVSCSLSDEESQQFINVELSKRKLKDLFILIQEIAFDEGFISCEVGQIFE